MFRHHKTQSGSRFSLLSGLGSAALILAASGSQAAPITLTAGDSVGNSSFNAAGGWSNGLAPSAGNAYSTNGLQIRTPADSNNYTFGGDSLTLTGTTVAASGLTNGGPTLTFKGNSGGPGGGNVITVNNLILDSGYVGNYADKNQTLAGNITLNVGGGYLDTHGSNPSPATNGQTFLINSAIAGSGKLTLEDSNGGPTGQILQLNHTNSYTGGTAVTTGATAFTVVFSAASADGSGPLAVNANTTVSLTANNALGAGTVTLTSGRLLNGNTTSSLSETGLGALTLANASTLDFGAANVGATFSFANSAASLGTGTLSVLNWTVGADQLFLGTTNSLSASQLSQISFVNPNGQTGTFAAVQLANGQVVAAPEPSGLIVLLAGTGLIGIIATRRRGAQTS